jgi:hypothetical protein
MVSHVCDPLRRVLVTVQRQFGALTQEEADRLRSPTLAIEILTAGDQSVGMSNMTPLEQYVIQRTIDSETSADRTERLSRASADS